MVLSQTDTAIPLPAETVTDADNETNPATARGFVVKDFRYIPGVSTLALERGECVGCGMCARVCPHGVMEIRKKRAEIVDPDGCMECGACARNCPVAAIRVTPGVGCAAAIIRSWIGKGGTVCCG